MRGHGAGGSRTVHCASRGKLQLGSRVAVAAALVAAAPGAATLGAAAIATIAFVAAVRAAATFADPPSPPALVAAVYPRRWRAAAGRPRIYDYGTRYICEHLRWSPAPVLSHLALVRVAREFV